MQIVPSELNPPAHCAEYYLFVANINIGKHESETAFRSYSQAIEIGKDLDEHYATEAALHRGYAAQQIGKMEVVEHYLKLSLPIKGNNNVYV